MFRVRERSISLQSSGPSLDCKGASQGQGPSMIMQTLAGGGCVGLLEMLCRSPQRQRPTIADVCDNLIEQKSC